MTSHTHKEQRASLEIFCSYAPTDEALWQQLAQRLIPWQRAGRIVLRHRGIVPPGANAEATLRDWQAQALVILLLVSPAFLADDTCHQQAQRAMQSSAKVILVILSPCHWSDTVFGGLQCLPRNGQAITVWNNKDQAWQEVTEEIRRAIDEVPLSCVSVPKQTAFPPIWNVPFARNPFFTGRDELLEQIHSQLQTTQTAAVSQPQVINGLGGIGKTQVAVEYAYRYASEHQAVLWVQAEKEEALNTAYAEIARRLQLPQREAKEQEIIVQAVKDWLSSQRGYLLILDNADEPEVLTSFLPSKIAGQVLVTTRASDLTDLGLGFQHALAVPTFTDDQGALFLLHRSNQLPLDATLDQAEEEVRQDARAITNALGGLPLALDQAGAYINKTRCSLAAYQQIHEKHRIQLLKDRRSAEHPESVATTWLISFEKVEQQNQASADLLRFCAFLAPDAIPEEILTKGAKELGERLSVVVADPLLLNDAIESLRVYSLIGRDAETQTLTVHRLVQAVVRDSLPIETQQQWMQRAIEAVKAAFPQIEFANWPTCDRLLPHALVCALWIKQLPEIPTVAAHLLNQAGHYLKERARYADAEPLYRRALAIREQRLGADHPDTALSLNNLAVFYLTQGKYSEALPLHQRALAICEQKFGADHPDTALSFNNLAVLYDAQGKYSLAEPLYQRAIAIREQHLGADHPDTAQSLNNLALLYNNQGKYGLAEPLYQRALAIWEQKLGADHPETARSLNNLALLYHNQSKYEQAEFMHQRALAIREQKFGADHPETAQSLHNLATLYYEQGKYTDAAPLFRRALTIREQALGPEHPRTAFTVEWLAYVAHQQGISEEAMPLYKRALSIFEHTLGQEHPRTRKTRGRYAALLRAIGHDAEAETLESEG